MKIFTHQQVCDGFSIVKTSPNRTIFSEQLVLCVLSLDTFTASCSVTYETNADAQRKDIVWTSFGLLWTTA